MVCQGWAWNLPSYLFAWVLVGFATPMMLGNAAMPGLVQVVGPNARSAITSLMLISGLTSTVFLPLNAWLLGTIGWRDAYIVFALLHLLVCAPLHWFALRTDAPRASSSTAAPARARSGFPPEGLLEEQHRRRALVLLSVWMCAEGLITWGLYLQIIDILVGLGLTANQSVAVWAIVGPCQAAARLIELMSAGRHSILTTSLGAALGVSLSFLALLPFGVSVSTAIVFCICIGTGHGLFAIARNTLPLALFGTKEYGTYIGLLTVPQNICNAIAPVAFAAILSHFSAAGTIWISAIAAWTGLVAVVFLNRFCRAAMKDRGIDL
jgi:predicted MFS family arabinose efflux permease